MKRTFFILLLFASFVACSYAQSTARFSGSLLWKVSGNKLTKPSYILGTHHLIDVSFADSIPGIEKVMKNTEQVVGELILSDEETAEMQAKMMQASVLPATEKYSDMLTESEYRKLDEAIKPIFGVGLDQLGTIKPGLISTMYTIGLYSKLMPGFDATKHEPIDKMVQKKAFASQKSVIGLETIEDQIYALFDAEPYKTQAKNLVCEIENENYYIEILPAFNAFYKKGLLNELYKMSFENQDDPCSSSEESKNALTNTRNNKWLAKLPAIMAEKPSLIAVGALHLAGEEGLLFQLDKMGYKVEAVTK